MNFKILIKIIFAILLAFLVNSFVYFSFGNIYSSKILNYKDFSEQFHGGIYQYRILSGYFLIWIYNFLGSLNIDYSIFKLKFLNPDSEPRMYLSFYFLNTLFLVLSSIMMVLITETKNFVATNSEKLLMVSVGIFAIAITQFVILPYDCSSYFFLLFFFWILIKYLNQNSSLMLIILILTIIFSTLNRESSALSIALAATLLLDKFGFKKDAILPIAIFGIFFVAMYFGMRFLSKSFTTNDGNLFLQNFLQPKNFLGLLFWLVFFFFSIHLSNGRNFTKNILVFHLFSLPYIFMCFYTGILYEARLYVPLFLTSLFLSKLATQRNLN